MGTRRRYTRLAPAELHQALGDPDYAKRRFGELRNDYYAQAGDRPSPEEARVLGVDKWWEEIDVVLRAAGMPVAVHCGVDHLWPREKPIDSFWEYFGEDEQRSMSPPTYLTPANTANVAEWMSTRPFDGLLATLDAEGTAALVALGGYPAKDYEVVAYLDVIRVFGDRVRRFFAAAAQSGDAIVTDLG
ncbi:hypothetical protein GCM10009682_33070 [Luedemannella flava]|uniref:DUF1877 family protein n=1 Tax=Luedemannella flava TaxID=349316 RepID=A0ABN2M408_9ACTN